MRITINQAALQYRYEQRGIIRLHACMEDRAAPTIAHLAALVVQHGATFAELTAITHDVALADHG